LNSVFEMCDLDSNGHLSKDELNLYTHLTSNEILTDEDWKFVGETVGFEKNNQLSKDAFLKLFKIEAERTESDSELTKDIENRLSNLGFNKMLQNDESCPFIIKVSSENSVEVNLLAGDIYRLKTAEKFFMQYIETNGNLIKIPKEIKSNLIAIEYHNDHFCVIVFQNINQQDDINIDIDLTKSDNCLTNLPDNLMKNSIRLKAGKSKIGSIVMALNSNKKWTIKCKIEAI
jgi:hypothetical protein